MSLGGVADWDWGAIPHPKVARSSAMDQHRDFAMSKDLDRLAAKDNRGNAVAAMRSHDD